MATMKATHREIKHGLSDLLKLMQRHEDNDHSGITLVLHDDGSGHFKTFHGDHVAFEFQHLDQMIDRLAAPVVCKHCNGTGKHS